jgi:hypothetical protein
MAPSSAVAIKFKQPQLSQDTSITAEENNTNKAGPIENNARYVSGASLIAHQRIPPSRAKATKNTVVMGEKPR